MIVYTANFGGKDKLKEPVMDSSWNKDLKFVYFTDQKFKTDIWDIRTQTVKGDSTRIARWYKTHPHVLFPGETTLWMDANLILIKDPTELANLCENILVQEHSFRTDVYEEAHYCLRKKKGEPKEVEAHLKAYQNIRFPRGTGLYTTRVLLRHDNPRTQRFNGLWWENIKEYSSRDQISLPLVLQTTRIHYNTIGFEELKLYFYKRGGHKFRGTREIE